MPGGVGGDGGRNPPACAAAMERANEKGARSPNMFSAPCGSAIPPPSPADGAAASAPGAAPAPGAAAPGRPVRPLRGASAPPRPACPVRPPGAGAPMSGMPACGLAAPGIPAWLCGEGIGGSGGRSVACDEGGDVAASGIGSPSAEASAGQTCRGYPGDE